MMLGRRLAAAGAALALSSIAVGAETVTIDRFVAHDSTVPANAGRRVGLFVREKVGAAMLADIEANRGPGPRVVLFVHGVSVPSVPDFDLPWTDYSWMQYLADAGFDTFAVDQSGYGHSPEPAMDDPCNLAPGDRARLDLKVTDACSPGYMHELTSSQTDWDEIDSVVDYLRTLRGVERISLIGWSLGGLRAGGYAARHPEKLERLVLYAPFYQPGSPAAAPAGFPRAGPPMTLQTRDALMNARWGANVACEDQVEPGIRDVIWQTIMSFDSYGSVWADGGIMRVRTASYWGWNRASAATVSTPTLILIGRQDGLLPGAEALYRDIGGTASKVLVRMECATHFAVWERSQYRFLHEASRAWLEDGHYRGQTNGEFAVGFGGVPTEQ